jgi:hypothetical protein
VGTVPARNDTSKSHGPITQARFSVSVLAQQATEGEQLYYSCISGSSYVGQRTDSAFWKVTS